MSLDRSVGTNKGAVKQFDDSEVPGSGKWDAKPTTYTGKPTTSLQERAENSQRAAAKLALLFPIHKNNPPSMKDDGSFEIPIDWHKKDPSKPVSKENYILVSEKELKNLVGYMQSNPKADLTIHADEKNASKIKSQLTDAGINANRVHIKVVDDEEKENSSFKFVLKPDSKPTQGTLTVKAHAKAVKEASENRQKQLAALDNYDPKKELLGTPEKAKRGLADRKEALALKESRLDFENAHGNKAAKGAIKDVKAERKAAVAAYSKVIHHGPKAAHREASPAPLSAREEKKLASLKKDLPHAIASGKYKTSEGLRTALTAYIGSNSKGLSGETLHAAVNYLEARYRYETTPGGGNYKDQKAAFWKDIPAEDTAKVAELAKGLSSAVVAQRPKVAPAEKKVEVAKTSAPVTSTVDAKQKEIARLQRESAGITDKKKLAMISDRINELSEEIVPTTK